jgi:hypothetical protein
MVSKVTDWDVVVLADNRDDTGPIIVAAGTVQVDDVMQTESRVGVCLTNKQVRHSRKEIAGVFPDLCDCSDIVVPHVVFGFYVPAELHQ